jgi:eukaryotic-like serine/threonine-protein kinase
MSDDRWARVEELYHSALGVSTEQRGAFVEVAAAGDSELRREVESLLAQHNSRDSVFDQPAWTDSRPEDKSAPQTGPMLVAGAFLGPYRITGLLGEGGMGQVYRAHDSRLQRSVAIKVLLLGQDVRRFEGSARGSRPQPSQCRAHLRCGS